MSRIEGDRGEPTGRNVSIDIPAELRHYRDRRRFLAVQTAQETLARFPLPHDYAELADLVRAGELVEMAGLGESYVLYGVGENATDEPFTHLDRKTGLSIALCASDDEFKEEVARLEDLEATRAAAIGQLQRQMRVLGRQDRSRRRAIRSQIAATLRHISHIIAERKLLQQYWVRQESRELLMLEKRSIENIAQDFGGNHYNLGDPASRRELKIRLLRFVRPEARAELLEIARQYHDKFSRPLPVTSLVRTEEYQRQLSEWNHNAARNASPPHVTGLAFDIYYHFMGYDEQLFLMSVIAGLKREGRVEALRETRDNIHVFAFADGQPPDEQLIDTAISEAGKTKYSARATARRARVHRRT